VPGELGGNWLWRRWLVKCEGGGVGDATPVGVGDILVWWTQGRPTWCRPTLGSGTQSRWDWGADRGGGEAGWK
jgi:hypothetical protein